MDTVVCGDYGVERRETRIETEVDVNVTFQGTPEIEWSMTDRT